MSTSELLIRANHVGDLLNGALEAKNILAHCHLVLFSSSSDPWNLQKWTDTLLLCAPLFHCAPCILLCLRFAKWL